jgi:hypothetical protein
LPLASSEAEAKVAYLPHHKILTGYFAQGISCHKHHTFTESLSHQESIERVVVVVR